MKVFNMCPSQISLPSLLANRTFTAPRKQNLLKNLLEEKYRKIGGNDLKTKQQLSKAFTLGHEYCISNKPPSIEDQALI